MAKSLLLITHNGPFHTDDVLGYAILRRAFGHGPEAPALELRRTRDKRAFAQADIIWDVGDVCDPARGRYDHHMTEGPRREDGTPYSSAGLLWRDYGAAVVRACLGGTPNAAVDEGLVAAVWEEVDRALILPVDLHDNGVVPAHGLSLASLVNAYRPTWDVPPEERALAEDAGFRDAATALDGFLRRQIDQARALVQARETVLDAHAASADPRVLELPRSLPWEDTVFAMEWPVLYAVYPDVNGCWRVGCMPPEPGSFENRLSLPEAWAGLSDAALAAASGVPDALFCHRNRFVASARSREGAMELARRALDLGLAPAAPGPR